MKELLRVLLYTICWGFINYVVDYELFSKDFWFLIIATVFAGLAGSIKTKKD